MRVSVIIVSYNARYYLEQCLYSVEKALQNIKGEIIVVDNDSPEKPIEKIKGNFPSVRFVESEKNLGFAKANNLGASMAKGEYLLILNPDTLVPEDLFEKLLPFADSVKDLGAIGVRMMDADGNFHPESKRNIPNFRNTLGKLFDFRKQKASAYYKEEVGEFENAPAEILTGAFMFLRKNVYLEAGGFDERYFMYGEDIDLSYTLINRGFTNYYFGELTILHYKGESTRKDKRYLKTFFGAMKLFVDKYYADDFISRFIFRTGLSARYLWALLMGGFKPGDREEKECPSEEELEKIASETDITKKSVQILLDGQIFSNTDLIRIISGQSQSGRHFYIKPSPMNVALGDCGIISLT